MKQKYEWFLTDGTSLLGKEAKTHLSSLVVSYENLFDETKFVLNDCLNQSDMQHKESLHETVLTNAESLAMIQIQLESLLEKFSLLLDQD